MNMEIRTKDVKTSSYYVKNYALLILILEIGYEFSLLLVFSYAKPNLGLLLLMGIPGAMFVKYITTLTSLIFFLYRNSFSCAIRKTYKKHENVAFDCFRFGFK